MEFERNKIGNNDKLLSLIIKWLRLPLIIAVIFIHMNPNVDIENVDYFSPEWIDFTI
ncbi:hypothetical protein D9V96_010415 [Zobellia laminariae]|uniref:hypothetical protein n=1 Tax=Zobellia laminariae TaxID=248906 RepID=UPI0012D9BBAD